MERVKFTWSSARHFFNTTPPAYPMILPRAAAPNIDQRNESEVSTSEKGIFEKIIPFITLKEITPVASLKSDSPSIIRFSLFGIGNLLKIAATAAASVAASIEPKRIPWIIGTLKIMLTPTAIRKMVRITPTIAKNPIGII
jgi:hypothetical protein